MMNETILNKKISIERCMVHEYQKLDLAIMVDVIEHHLYEPLEFANLALRIMEASNT